MRRGFGEERESECWPCQPSFTDLLERFLVQVHVNASILSFSAIESRSATMTQAGYIKLRLQLCVTDLGKITKASSASIVLVSQHRCRYDLKASYPKTIYAHTCSL